MDKPTPLIFHPPVLTAFPAPPPSSSSTSSPVPNLVPQLEGQSLTNENLLKSIGFIPSANVPSSADVSPSADIQPPGDVPPPADDAMPLVKIDSTEAMAMSTDHLLQTFEMVEDPFGFNSAETNSNGDLDSFVVVVPDCFNLDKPLTDFSPPTSLSHVVESLNKSYTELSMSCDSHVTSVTNEVISVASPIPLPSNESKESAPQEVPIEKMNEEDTTDPPPQKDATESTPNPASEVRSKAHLNASPSTAHKPLCLPTNRFSFRALKGGLRNPLAVATGLVNKVSEFVDDKVHFTPSVPRVAADGKNKKPTIQFAEGSSSEDSGGEFEVYNTKYNNMLNFRGVSIHTNKNYFRCV